VLADLSTIDMQSAVDMVGIDSVLSLRASGLLNCVLMVGMRLVCHGPFIDMHPC